VGRIGLSIGAVPAVIPIRYEVSEAGILVACSIDQVAKAMEHTVVALQSYGFDEDIRKRWTVLAIGPTERIATHRLDTGGPDVDLPTWNFGSVRDAPHLFRLDPGVLSGRWLDGF
jgi:hypothetical protein